MNKRKLLGIGLILAAVLLVTATGVVAANSLRHGSGPTNLGPEGNYEEDDMWGPMHELGWYSDQESGISPLHTVMVETLAEVSELSVEEIEMRINNGEHIITIASDAGLSLADYYQIMFDVRASYLEGVTDEDQFSEEGYKWMFEHMDEFQTEPFFSGCHDLYPSEYEQNYQRNGRRK